MLYFLKIIMLSPESPFTTIKLSPPEPLCELERRLDLYGQYTTIKRALTQTGLLSLLPFTPLDISKGIEPLGIVGIKVEYPFPPYRVLQHAVKEQHALYEKKAEQGFTALDVSLTAMAIPELQRRSSELLRRHHAQKPYSHLHPGGTPQLLGTKQPRDPTHLIPLDLNDQRPIYIHDDILTGKTSGQLLYYPDSCTTPYGGYTKPQLITHTENTFSPGYEFFFTSPYTFLPLQGKGQSIGGRKQLENNNSPYNYLHTLQQDKEYAHEVGLTMEHFLTTFSTHLFLTNEVSYDYYDDNVAWLIGNMVSVNVPNGYWNRDSRRLGVSGYNPGNRGGGCGCPSAVRVFPFT